MKVLVTSEIFPPDFGGGGEYIMLELVRGLLRHGVEVSVVSTGDPKVNQYDGIPTIRLPVSTYRFNLQADAIAEVGRGYDLIQTCFYHASLPSAIAGKRLGIPVVSLVMGLFQDVWKEMRGAVVGTAFSAWERFLLRQKYDKLIYISDFSRDLGLQAGTPAEKSVVLFPGIDLENYGPSPVKEDVVFFTGKLEVRKGIYDVLAVARALPHVKFRVMGWGPDENRIRALAPPNVEFRPYTFGEPGPELRKGFADARIFLFPSKGETLGLVVVEAMASGCAVVSSVPLEFAGARVAPSDQAAMIKAIDNLWRDRQLTEQMGRDNLRDARRYNWTTFTNGLLSIYKSLLDR